MMMMMEEEEEENQQPKENEEGGEGEQNIVPSDIFVILFGCGFFLCVWFKVSVNDFDIHVGKPDDKKEKGGDKADEKVR